MTLHTYTTYCCTCGQIGAVHTSENDQPYSQNWERTRLENLGGSETSPRCIACKAPLDDSHIIPGKPGDYT
ncbi:hypothetical protein HEP73_00620 [Xanthomonas sp. GW]|nr:hypothetical protein HEP73_00620 [Xanthomonas sp. GW]